MTRALAASFLALSVAFGGMAVIPAAHAKGGATKVCRYKKSDGTIKTWRCGRDQPCCAAEIIDYYTCGSQTLQCL